MVRCEKCLGFYPVSSINVHHLTYERLGLEENRDLQILCRGCHERTHGIEKQSENIRVAKSALPGNVLPTGFAGIDSLTGGIEPGELIVLGSRPSVGKSALALCIARNVAIQSRMPVMFVTFEMSASDLVTRAIAQTSGVHMRSLLHRPPTPEETEFLTNAQKVLAASPFYVFDAEVLSVDQIVAAVERHVDTDPIRLVVVDYIQHLSLPDGGEYRDKKIAGELRRLRQACKALGTSCIALTGLKRSVENRPDCMPAMADFYAAGDIEHDADQVWALWRAGYYDWAPERQASPESKVIVLKNRRAPTGEVRLVWHPEIVTFTEPE